MKHSITTRVSRYLVTYLWLLRRQMELGGKLFWAALGTGVIERIGTMSVFVIMMKCAFWLLYPDRIPAFLLQAMPFMSGSAGVVVLLAIPTIVMIVVSFAGTLYLRYSVRLAAFCGSKLASLKLDHMTGELRRGKISAKQLLKQSQAVTTAHQQAFTKLNQANLDILRLLICILSLAAVSLLAMVIDSVISSMFLLVALVMALPMIWHLHYANYENAARAAADTASNKADAAKLKELIASHIQGKADAQTIGAHVERVEAARIAQKHRSGQPKRTSKLVLDLGQAALLMILLGSLYLRGKTTDPSHIAMLFVLVLILRFALQQVRELANTLVALTKQYRLLTEMRALPAPAPRESPQTITAAA